MTRIQPKAPPIQQPPRRERFPGEVAGKHFNEVLNARPAAEHQAALTSQQHETQTPDRDPRSAPDSNPDRAQLEARIDQGASLADVVHAAYPPGRAVAPPSTALHVSGQGPVAQDARLAPTSERPLPPSGVETAVEARDSTVAIATGPVVASPSGVDVQAGAQESKRPSSGLASSAPQSQTIPLDRDEACLPQAGERGQELTTTVAMDEPRELPVPSGKPRPVPEMPRHAESDPMIVMTEVDEVAESTVMAMRPSVDESPSLKEMALVPEAAPHQPQEPLHLQTSIGRDNQDWLVRPWRLQASAGLSFRSNAPTAVAVLGRRPLWAGATSPAAQSNSPSMSADFLESGALPARWKSVLRLPVQLEPASARMDADGIESSDPVGATGGQLAAWLHWSQRMLRWNGNATDAGGITAWVRDYTLDASEVPALIQALVALSGEQGFSLGRIMVNGHEAWSSGEQFHMTRGDHDGR